MVSNKYPVKQKPGRNVLQSFCCFWGGDIIS